MDTDSDLRTTLGQDFVTSLRQRRAELRESMSALEHALAAPVAGDRIRWGQRVHVALVELSSDLKAHIEITEGPGGLYRELRAAAPRLCGAVDRLTADHLDIGAHLEMLLAEADSPDGDAYVERLRGLGNDLLGRLVRHRQQGADLVFEAYEVDVGGET